MHAKLGTRLLKGATALALSVSTLPAFHLVTGVMAEENDGLVLNKTAQLEDDGTYTITLEAYATGRVETTTTTTTTEEIVPTDIILVLDQSGSMVQNNVDGIPTGYQKATVTNADINNGTYYYKAADGEYYKVKATKEIISKTVAYVGEDGKTYQLSDLSTSWTASNGMVYNTPTPFVTSSLKTFTRQHKKTVVVNSWWYTNDNNPNEKSDSGISAKSARDNFVKKFDDNTHTVMLMNVSEGEPDYNSSDDNKNYTAAQYIAVTQKETEVYRYTYTYVDAKGKTVTIGTSAEGTESVVDNASASAELYSTTTSSGTRLQALQYAAGEFVDGIYENAIANNVDHRVAIVGFASDAYGNSNNQYYYSNTELFVGGTQYNYSVDGKNSTYNTAGNLAANHYGDAFQNANSTSGYQNLKASINALAGHGGTHPDLGFEMANGIFKNNTGTYTKADGTTANRNRIVIFMTDGEPGDTSFDDTVANNAKTQANTAKNTYKATVYAVGVLNKDDANDQNTAFLKAVSSNNDYTLATGGADLSEFFQTVSSTITDTTTTTTTDVTLTEDAWLVDEISNYFTVPDDFSIANNVTCAIAKHTGDYSFANPVITTALTVTPRTGADNATVIGVNVQGFNFADQNNWVSTSVSDGGSTVAKGNKLVVTIKGLLAKDAAATGTYIDTNTDASGIWDNGTVSDGSNVWSCVKAFNKPKTMLDQKSFVLDYAKEAALDVYNATKVDSAEDKLFSKVDASNTTLSSLSYGKVTTAGGLKYTPNTMNWNGYDTFYALGKDAAKGDHKTQNIWSKVNVLPANSVYYEDDFKADDETASIVYAPDSWTTVGSSSENKETADNTEHGWETSLNDDNTYTDGSAHVTSTVGATAEFTFTGTGVDVYSYTNMTTGRVFAKLYSVEANKTVLTKTLTVDDLAQSGEYYQIPTVSFTGLDYGTYKVQLTVKAVGERKTYYLDGIRVYNPLSEETQTDTVVENAYGDEINASFMEIRDILITPESEETEETEETEVKTLSGAVFIDYNPSIKHDEKTAEIAKYKAYGPKNEVYLQNGQAIAFRIVGADNLHLAVGLKSPTGNPVTVESSFGGTKQSKTIRHTADMYYGVTPDENGFIIITNTSGAMLAVTKLKMSGEPIEVEGYSLAEFTADEVVNAANRFTTLSLYEEPEQDNNAGDVIIDIPAEEPVVTPAENWVTTLIKNIKKLFGR